MSITDLNEIETQTVPSPTPSSGRSTGVKIALAIVALVVAFLFAGVLLFGALIAGRVTESGPTVDTIENDVVVVEQVASDLSYDYFGEMAIARNSSVNTVVSGVDSLDNIEIASVPDGINAQLTADGSVVLLDISIDGDVPSGVSVITFNIVGESATVEWAFTVV